MYKYSYFPTIWKYFIEGNVFSTFCHLFKIGNIGSGTKSYEGQHVCFGWGAGGGPSNQAHPSFSQDVDEHDHKQGMDLTSY